MSAPTSTGTTYPVSPSSTTSGRPPTAVATTGNPAAIASGTTSGSPSLLDGSANTSNAGSSRSTSIRRPVSWIAGPIACARAATSLRSGPSPTNER